MGGAGPGARDLGPGAALTLGHQQLLKGLDALASLLPRVLVGRRSLSGSAASRRGITARGAPHGAQRGVRTLPASSSSQAPCQAGPGAAAAPGTTQPAEGGLRDCRRVAAPSKAGPHASRTGQPCLAAPGHPWRRVLG